MKLPLKGWVIVCPACDNSECSPPNESVYSDLDWAVYDAKERNKDHAEHRVVAVKVEAALKGESV